jgi:TolB-like protein/Flp pilus assembly protein TadD
MADAPNGPERLNSWKEIAAHLSVSVRTAQRWENTEDLPARRHRHAALGSVFAYRSELDAWWNSRPQLRAPAPRAAGAPTAGPSIAVLPFVNLNRDEENEIFSDGLTEELINALAQVEGLQVVARTSAFHFKGKNPDIRTVGAKLGVRTVLEGSVRRSAERLRITAQLINAADGCHLWSQRYDRRVEDVFDVQEELAQGIVNALRARLTGERITRQYGRDLAAYTLYLEGRYHWNKRTPTGFTKAVECFEKVLAKDSGMALAWAGLADCYAMVGPIAGMAVDEAARKARHAALKALEIDSSLAEAHTPLGFIRAAYDYEWADAEAAFRRALELNPNHAPAHLLYAAIVLGPTGRLEEAIHHQRRACELDPLSAVMAAAVGTLAVALRHFDEAIAAARRALELDAAYPWAYRALGEACLLKGLYAEAADAFSRIEGPLLGSGFLGYSYARGGREEDARRLLGRLKEMNSPNLALQISVLHLGLREPDQAFEALEIACDTRLSPGIHWLKVEPIWDELRADARFGGLLSRINLDQTRVPGTRPAA